MAIMTRDALSQSAVAQFAPLMNSVPVDVSKCAASVGLPIFAVDMPQGISGMLVRNDVSAGTSGFSCYVNKNEPSVRQRFTAAHELGHYMLHADQIGTTLQDNYLLRANGLSNAQEAEANQFAADLLMPRHLISQAMNSGTTSVDTLAKLFRVSTIAMSIRLGLPT